MFNPNDADQCCDRTLVQDLQCATVSRSCIKYLPDKININILATKMPLLTNLFDLGKGYYCGLGPITGTQLHETY